MPLQSLEARNSACFAALLSRLYLESPDIPLLQELALTPLNEAWPFPATPRLTRALQLWNQSLSLPPAAHAHSLREEHMLLFIGPGMPLAPLWASVYLDSENLLFRSSSLALARFFSKAGLACTLPDRQPHDHLGLCLSALNLLLQRHAFAEPALQQNTIQDLRDLLSIHLSPWTARCCSLIEEHAASKFYQACALLTAALLEGLMEYTGAKAQPSQLFY